MMTWRSLLHRLSYDHIYCIRSIGGPCVRYNAAVDIKFPSVCFPQYLLVVLGCENEEY